MIYVTNCKIVVGFHTYNVGDEIHDISREAEDQLIAAGLAARSNDTLVAEEDEPAITSFVVTYDNEQAEDEPRKRANEPTRAQLQERCRELGLSDRGNKAQLRARIDEYEYESEGEPESGPFDDEEPPDLKAEVPR